MLLQSSPAMVPLPGSWYRNGSRHPPTHVVLSCVVALCSAAPQVTCVLLTERSSQGGIWAAGKPRHAVTFCRRAGRWAPGLASLLLSQFIRRHSWLPARAAMSSPLPAHGASLLSVLEPPRHVMWHIMPRPLSMISCCSDWEQRRIQGGSHYSAVKPPGTSF